MAAYKAYLREKICLGNHIKYVQGGSVEFSPPKKTHSVVNLNL